MTVLERAQWQARQRAHHTRVDALLEGHRRRSSRAIKHPVEDFLFQYYSFRPVQLRRWHPGHGVILADAADWVAKRDYRAAGAGVRVDAESLVVARSQTVHRTYALLVATSERRGSFGCFGMHEWAMVDGLERAELRHPQLGLRLAPHQVSATVRAVGVRCTHIDAYRFFTASAKPLNHLTPTRETQVDLDQPGCLHVGMDLYRLAYKLSPLIAAELVTDCFELARRIRVVDMRASPYDLSSLGLTPIAVETAEGRAEYAAAQRELADRARPLRRTLLRRVSALRDLLADQAGQAAPAR